MLIILSGLPGTGKTTIAKALIVKRSAAYVRVDEIEHALSQLGSGDVGPAGYLAAYAIASSNLSLGIDVIADSVNPVPESRKAWRDVAEHLGKPFLEVEIVCTDRSEHKRRVETRTADIAGFKLPSWSSVETHEYAPWTTARLLLDTAKLDPAEAAAKIEAHIVAMSGKAPPLQ